MSVLIYYFYNFCCYWSILKNNNYGYVLLNVYFYYVIDLVIVKVNLYMKGLLKSIWLYKCYYWY